MNFLWFLSMCDSAEPSVCSFLFFTFCSVGTVCCSVLVDLLDPIENTSIVRCLLEGRNPKIGPTSLWTSPAEDIAFSWGGYAPPDPPLFGFTAEDIGLTYFRISTLQKTPDSCGIFLSGPVGPCRFLSVPDFQPLST